MSRPPFSLAGAAGLLAAALLVSISSRAAAADWPRRAERSGTWLPEPREIALAIRGSGAYVPEVSGLSSAETGIAIGSLAWCLAPWKGIGLFGEHSLGRMWWGEQSLLISGHELGARFPLYRYFSMEAAYLGHSSEKQWVEENEVALGGVRDNGAELGAWFHAEPLSRLRVELHLLGRYFDVYRHDQLVAGLGARVGLMPVDGHALEIELEALRARRYRPRSGVDESSWNLLGSIEWRSRIAGDFGISIGGRVSTQLLVGEMPMLELKRSMIDEPMALASLGLFFVI